MKKYNKRYRRKKPSLAFASSLTLKRPTIFPDKYNVKMVYSDQNNLSGAVTDYYIYRGAGAYDPDYIAAGRYCAGWTQLDNIYNRYVCHGSKITLKIVSTGAGTNLATSGLFVVIPRQALAVITNPSYQWLDEPYAKGVVVGGAGGTSVRTLSSYMSYKTLLGKAKNTKLQDDSLAISLTNANPTNDWYWHFMATSIDQSSNLNQISVFVKIVYYVTFYERIDQFSSTGDNADNTTDP